MSAAAEQLPSTSQVPADTSGQPSGVVIVGGGPAGLALALTLVQLHGHTDVTVLEQRPLFTFTAPDKSYVYLVDGRSRKLLDRLGLSVELDDIGVRTTRCAAVCGNCCDLGVRVCMYVSEYGHEYGRNGSSLVRTVD